MATSSFKEILKSTTVIGGSKVITIIIGIVRTKVIALLLGSLGVGLISLFNSALTLVRNVSQLGLNFSSVKDIAEAVGEKDEEKIAKTVTTLRRWVWFTGLFGLTFVLVFSGKLSELTFEDKNHQLDFVLLSSTILFGAINGGQLAILRGFRKINEIAKANIWSATIGVLVAVPLYFTYGIKGIVPVLILSGLASVVISYLYTKNIQIKPLNFTLRESLSFGKGMVSLGLFTVVSGLVTNAVAYYLRVYINMQADIATVGLFAVASTLSVYYLDIVLSTLGTDYFPRLSEASKDNKTLSRLINEQTIITLLLGVPLVGIMMILANQVIVLFYSSEFLPATSLLQWMLLGVSLRLLSWPKSYAFLVKAKGFFFVIIEILWNATYIGTVIWLFPRYGLKAVGIGFTVSYLMYYAIYLACTRRYIEFNYSMNTLKVIVPLYVCLGTIFFLVNQEYTVVIMIICGLVYTVLLLFSIYSFNSIVPLSDVLSKLKSKFKPNK